MTDKFSLSPKQEQKKIAFKTVKYNEIKTFSDCSGIPMATILTKLWDEFKGGEYYKQLMLFGDGYEITLNNKSKN